MTKRTQLTQETRPRVVLVVDLPDYGPDFVQRVHDLVQKSIDNRWPAAGIKVTRTGG